MQSARLWKTCLLVAGMCSASMALYHYWLPYQWDWPSDLRRISPAVGWGSLMVNFCFSTLLLWGGVMTLLAAMRWRKRDAMTTATVAGMGVFWLMNAAYQAAIPMPLPPRLHVLGWVLLGFAVIVMALHGVALWAGGKQDPRGDHATPAR